jgi:4-coumarate--CoA ligase
VAALRQVEVESFLKVHARFQVTDLLIVLLIVNAIVVSGLADPKDLRSVQYGILGAAPLGTVMQRRLQELMATLGQLWGMTELTCIATDVKPGTNSEEVDDFGLVGTPIPNVELRVVDEDGKDVSDVPDVKDEICVREPTVTKGYFEMRRRIGRVMYFIRAQLVLGEMDGLIF